MAKKVTKKATKSEIDKALKDALPDNTVIAKKGEYTFSSSPDKVKGELLLQFFEYEHLPPHLQQASRPFSHLAYQIVRDIPKNAERTICLRNLILAKDNAVRAVLYKENWNGEKG